MSDNIEYNVDKYKVFVFDNNEVPVNFVLVNEDVMGDIPRKSQKFVKKSKKKTEK